MLSRVGIAALSTLIAGVGATTARGPVQRPRPQPTLSYERDIRPILAENCFACHGPDAGSRKGGLRLDELAGATKVAASGGRAVVPGDPVASTLLHRVDSPASAPGHMPPPSTGKTIAPRQRELLRRWIGEGARYEIHWAFVPPRDHIPPKVDGVTDPIDAFLNQRIRQAGLEPTRAADRATLLRRVSFDLVGLPPSPEEVDAFVADKRADAYERVVDRLLASPHFGERMAIGWLDLARYADTHGYHIDSHRDMFRWRDWVIDAFNRNLPYDQFVSEQIAGDLLPNPTLDQRIATGFNRNHPINFEGGAIPEEYRNAYVADRVDTTATAFLGLTLRCAQCHDHKVEPFSQSDYYRFYAFFNNVDEEGLDGQRGNAKPMVVAPTREQSEQLTSLRARKQAIAQQIGNVRARLESSPDAGSGALEKAREALNRANLLRIAESPGIRPDSSGQSIAPGNTIDTDLTLPAEQGGLSYGGWVWLESTDQNQTVVSRMDTTDGLRGWDLFVAAGGRPMAHFIHRWPDSALRVDAVDPIPARQWVHLWVTWDGTPRPSGVRIFVDGKPVATNPGVSTLSGETSTRRPVRVGGRWPGADLRGKVANIRISRGVLPQSLVAFLVASERVPGDKGTSSAPHAAAEWWLENEDPEYARMTRESVELDRKIQELESGFATTMVMQERTGNRRQTHILTRGQYDKPTSPVDSGLPAVFRPSHPARTTGDRRDVAAWMVSPSNPLVARVAVNRLWQHFFGTGLVATAENFGTQGERPSHPELLDHLAVSYRTNGWNTKAFIRRLVLTQAYRRSSFASPAARRIDPANRLLSHAPRLRLPAELIRDQALAASGLLVPTIGGPSVKIYQPAGLWEEMSFKGDFSAQYYVQDHGDKLWRRSLYTFWKRTVPPPSLQTFDAPEREFCVVRRAPTNTPLQALVTLNDPGFVEAARQLASVAMREANNDPARVLDRIFRRVLGRVPTADERSALMRLANRESSSYRRDPARATAILQTGESPVDPRQDKTMLAAWTSVALAVLNLDEALNRG
jgi:hypothetical protein